MKIHLRPNDWAIMCGTFILSTENKSFLICCFFLCDVKYDDSSRRRARREEWRVVNDLIFAGYVFKCATLVIIQKGLWKLLVSGFNFLALSLLCTPSLGLSFLLFSFAWHTHKQCDHFHCMFILLPFVHPLDPIRNMLNKFPLFFSLSIISQVDFYLTLHFLLMGLLLLFRSLVSVLSVIPLLLVLPLLLLMHSIRWYLLPMFVFIL